MKIKNYKDLEVWKKGVDIVDEVYNVNEEFPDHEKFGLTAQMRRSAVSIPSNIAEGFMRQHSKEYIQFLYISLGSCAELETQIIISSRRKFIQSERLTKLQDSIDHECRMITNLIKTVRF